MREVGQIRGPRPPIGTVVHISSVEILSLPPRVVPRTLRQVSLRHLWKNLDGILIASAELINDIGSMGSN